MKTPTCPAFSYSSVRLDITKEIIVVREYNEVVY